MHDIIFVLLIVDVCLITSSSATDDCPKPCSCDAGFVMCEGISSIPEGERNAVVVAKYISTTDEHTYLCKMGH